MKRFLLLLAALLLAVPSHAGMILRGSGTSSPYEDFTTFTEVDPGSTVSVAANTITGAQVDVKNSDTYVYKDYGAGYFGDFTHQFSAKATMDEGTADVIWVWGLTNTVDDYGAWAAGIGFGFYGQSWSRTVVQEKGGSTDFSTQLSNNTIYYFTITRSGTSLTATVYSDSGRTNTVYTHNITVASTTYRYLYALTSQNLASSGWLVDATIYDFDLSP